MRHHHPTAVAALTIAFVVAAGGCGPVDPGGLDAGPEIPSLSITTESVATGRAGAAYAQQLAATGGLKPYGWSLDAKSAELAWLRVDPASGVLTGTPLKPVASAPVTVVVTDQRAVSATRAFVLTVDGCTDGETTACHAATSAGCEVGTATCANGEFPSDCSGAPSTRTDLCGPDCSACGANADHCESGLCACGTMSACAEGQLCCGGQCVDPDDPKTCGACGNDCTAELGVHVTATCSAGQCGFACEPEFKNCAPGSTPENGCPIHVADDLQNCGACNHVCATDLATANAPSCNAGVCAITCHADRLDCDDSPEDGCETPRTPTDCTACHQACHPAGTDNVATPQCVPDKNGVYGCAPVCTAPFQNCNGQDGDGCEINLKTDVNNCGACGNVCPSVNGAAPGCFNGVCKVASCPAGTLDCNGKLSDGCEKLDNLCGCGCAPGEWCGPNGCEECSPCGGVACCHDTCQYCPNSLEVECGPCL